MAEDEAESTVAIGLGERTGGIRRLTLPLPAHKADVYAALLAEPHGLTMAEATRDLAGDPSAVDAALARRRSSPAEPEREPAMIAD